MNFHLGTLMPSGSSEDSLLLELPAAGPVRGPVGHFKIPHLWSPKIPQAGHADYQLTEVFCASRVAASLSR